MGWIHSPPFFSAVTETAADVMNHRLNQGREQPPHRLETLALAEVSPPVVHSAPATGSSPTVPVPSDIIHKPGYKRPLRYADIYVDDFIALAQGSLVDRLNTMRTVLHVLDSVLPPHDPSDHEHQQEPASVKKLKKRDAQWNTKKTVLEWVINTVTKSIELPPHRFDRLKEILSSIRPKQKRTTATVWHKVLGELRSMVLIVIPGARGLFSTLQTVFGTAADPTSHDGRRRLRLNHDVHTFLDDFRTLALELPQRPTRPVLLSYCHRIRL